MGFARKWFRRRESAPEEHDVYSRALLIVLRSSGARCAWPIYIPLLPERNTLGIQGYKHFAPPEQTSAAKDDFSCKAP
jgi:hypothetical protein